MPTSRQTQDYLLCSDCDNNVLNKLGEAWSLPRLATIEQKFPLYDAVTRVAPGFEEHDMRLYFAAGNLDIDVDKLTHFALGMFWKASIHSWKGNSREPRIELGPYSDPIRRYLLGEAAFPSNVVLVVNITQPSRAMISFIDPYEGKRQGGWRTFFCYVPGIVFSLNVGKEVSDDLQVSCFASNVHHPIMVMDSLHDKAERTLKEMYFRSPKARIFLEAQKRRSAQLERAAAN